jgi:hypothetical protein
MYTNYKKLKAEGQAVLRIDPLKTLVMDITEPETVVPEKVTSTALADNTPELVKASIEGHRAAIAAAEAAIESDLELLADWEALTRKLG